jgi:hypothetical protein
MDQGQDNGVKWVIVASTTAIVIAGDIYGVGSRRHGGPATEPATTPPASCTPSWPGPIPRGPPMGSWMP